MRQKLGFRAVGSYSFAWRIPLEITDLVVSPESFSQEEAVLVDPCASSSSMGSAGLSSLGSVYAAMVAA